jgi:hypothetical protein
MFVVDLFSHGYGYTALNRPSLLVFACAVEWIQQKETRLMIPSAGIDLKTSWRGDLVPASRWTTAVMSLVASLHDACVST